MSWTVDEVMTRDVAWIRPDTSVKATLAVLRGRGVSAVPVVAHGGVVGVVSEADLLVKVEPQDERGGARHAAAALRKRVQGRTAAELMSSPPITVSPGTSIGEAARLMHSRGVKRLPVVDDSGRLVGMVSRSDLLKVFLRPDEALRSEIAEVLRKTLWLGEPDLHVSVVNGVATLRGTVDTRSLAEMAMRLTRSVPGVAATKDEMRFKVDDARIGDEQPPLALQLAARERQGL